MKGITYIYLVENCYGDPNKVYIGKTKNSRKNNHKRKYGITIEYTIIDEINSLFRKDWGPIETYWIEQFKQWGFEIMNPRKKGGGGREFFTEEQKQRFRRPCPEYVKKKISIGNKGKIRDKESRQNISIGRTGVKLSEEQKLKLRGRKRSKESKIKQSQTNKGRKITWNLKTKGKNISTEQKNKIALGNSKPVLQLDINDNIIKEYKSYTESKNITGIDAQWVLIGKNKTAGGYKWKYK